MFFFSKTFRIHYHPNFRFSFPLSGKPLLCRNFSSLKFIVWLFVFVEFLASSIPAPSLFFGCSFLVLYALTDSFALAFLFGSFVLHLLSFAKCLLLEIFYSIFNNYVCLEDLRVHWYHLFVSIRYHSFLCFAICNVVQSKQKELV